MPQNLSQQTMRMLLQKQHRASIKNKNIEALSGDIETECLKTLRKKANCSSIVERRGQYDKRCWGYGVKACNLLYTLLLLSQRLDA